MKASVWKKEFDLVHYQTDEADGVEIPDAMLAEYEVALRAFLLVADRIEDIADAEYRRRAQKRTMDISADNAARRAAAYEKRAALMSSRNDS